MRSIRHTLLSALTAGAMAATPLLQAPTAHADVVDAWTTYASMNACQQALLDLNSYCYGLADGQVLGLVDVAFAVDELDQALGVYYDDENPLPEPEGPDNPVVQVWNNTGDLTFIAGGTSFATDIQDDVPVYYIPPHTDVSGPALDADAGIVKHASYSSSTIDYDIALVITSSDIPINGTATEY